MTKRIFKQKLKEKSKDSSEARFNFLKNFCFNFERSDPELSSKTRLCEERADNSRKHGDDKLDDGLPAFEVLDHNDKIR